MRKWSEIAKTTKFSTHENLMPLRYIIVLKNTLKNYDPQNEIHRSIIAYVCIPVLEKETNLFVTNWNNHRIRFQKGTVLPDGIQS